MQLTTENSSLQKSKLEFASKRSWILLLAALSGCCGLAYEILLIRLFSNYFGNSFVVSGITLCAVFLGISFGAVQSFRFVRWLGYIEIGIGFYAIVSATVFSNWGFDIAGLGNGNWFNVLKLSFLLGFPTFLFGTCVPLFTSYAKEVSQETNVFTRVYGLYNLGAFLSILAIEFWLYRTLGLQVTIVIIGCLNLAIGGILLMLEYNPDKIKPSSVKTDLNRRIALTLFLASFVSGIFQLFVLRLSFSIFGPLHENFAIILASAILGVAIGSWWSLKSKLHFQNMLYWLLLIMPCMLIFVPALIQVWGMITSTEISDHAELAAKVVLLGCFPLPLFIFFGTLIPLAISVHEDSQIRLSGKLLAISSLGNGLGSLTMFLILYRYLSLPQIGLFMICLLILAGIFGLKSKPSLSNFLGGSLVAASLCFAVIQIWPYKELLLGYRIISQQDQLKNRLQSFREATTYKAYDQSASVLSFDNGGRSLVFNGYHSLSFGSAGKSDLHETIVGATPVLFTENTKNALVLGLGTGITAGSSSRLFEQVQAIEINPAILKIPRHFADENHNIMSRTNVEIILQDGISTLLETNKKFDAIINTVTSPKYYAASKLYTVDFLKLAKSKLAIGGVYSTWFDLNIDQDGIAIMLNTLETSFEHCRYFVLTGSYFNAICANQALIYKPNATVTNRTANKGMDRLFERYGFSEGFAGTMNALEISFDSNFFERSSTEINSLDHPAIEFIVARSIDKRTTSDALSNTILANLEFQRKFSFGNGTWKKNCRYIAQMSYLEFSGCENKQ